MIGHGHPFKKSRPRATRGGYTIIEVIVAIAIIGILAGFAFAGLYGANSRENTRNSALEIRSTLRNMQEQALTSKLNSAGNPAAEYVVVVTPTYYQTVRIEKGNANPVTPAATVVTQPTLYSTGVTVSTTPPLQYISFTENKSQVKFYDSAGNPVAAAADGAVAITVTGGSTGGTQVVKIYQATGRIE